MARELRKGDGGLRGAAFTPREVAYCEGKREPARAFARHFAAKEAVLKALSTGCSDGVGFRDVEIRERDRAEPVILLSGRAGEVAARRRITGIRLALSSTPELAMATVVVESPE